MWEHANFKCARCKPAAAPVFFIIGGRMSRLEMSVREKTLFHKEYYGPDCAISEAILELMGRKNFMKQQLNLLQEAGGKVTIKEVKDD